MTRPGKWDRSPCGNLVLHIYIYIYILHEICDLADEVKAFCLSLEDQLLPLVDLDSPYFLFAALEFECSLDNNCFISLFSTMRVNGTVQMGQFLPKMTSWCSKKPKHSRRNVYHEWLEPEPFYLKLINCSVFAVYSFCWFIVIWTTLDKCLTSLCFFVFFSITWMPFRSLSANPNNRKWTIGYII